MFIALTIAAIHSRIPLPGYGPKYAPAHALLPSQLPPVFRLTSTCSLLRNASQGLLSARILAVRAVFVGRTRVVRRTLLGS
jgi:hypothetical protein